MADKDFEFRIPRGVDVVTNGPVPANSRSPASRSRPLLVPLVAVARVGCATTGSLSAARDAESQQDYDLRRRRVHEAAARATRTIATRAPALERAKLRASQDHFSRARARLAATGKLEEALVEYQLAAELNPGNGDIQTRAAGHAHAAAHQGRGPRRRQDAARDADRREPRRARCPAPTCPTDVTLPDSLVFREASARDIFSAIGKFANLSVVFDPTFRDQPVIDRPAQAHARRGARRRWRTTTRNFWRVDRAAHAHRSFPTRPPSGASTKKRSSARST